MINDTSLLTDETRKRLENAGFIHINIDGPLTEEIAIDLLERFAEIEKRLEQE